MLHHKHTPRADSNRLIAADRHGVDGGGDDKNIITLICIAPYEVMVAWGVSLLTPHRTILVLYSRFVRIPLVSQVGQSCTSLASFL